MTSHQAQHNDVRCAVHCRSQTAEANVHALVTLNTLMATVAGVCVYFLYDDDDKDDNSVEYAVNGGLILWTCLVNNVLNLSVRVRTRSCRRTRVLCVLIQSS